MSKSLKHYKPKNHKNKTMRNRRKARKQRKSRGGQGEFVGNLDGLGENVLALHHSETCSHCKTFKPEWKKVLKRLSKVDPSLFTVAEVGPDATQFMNKNYYETPVNAVPTIVYIHKMENDDVKPEVYEGERRASAIIAWLAKTMAENHVKITIESDDADADAHTESQESHESFAKSEPEPEPEPEPSTFANDAFPPAPQQPDPDVGAEAAPPLAAQEPQAQNPSTLSKATDAIKNTASVVDDKIGKGVDAIKSAFTKDIDFGNMFSSKPKPDETGAPPANPVANNPANPDLAPAPAKVPAMPSLVGGRKNHRYTRRRTKSKSKSKRKTKSKRKSV